MRREGRIKSRDLSNRSLKTDRETEIGEPTKGFLERKRGRKQNIKSRDLSNGSLKTDGEIDSRDLT